MPTTLNSVAEDLRQKYNAACDDKESYISEITRRALDGGDGLSDEERSRIADFDKRISTLKEGYEAQRDLERMASEREDINTVEREVTSVTDAAGETQESTRQIIRDGLGREGLEAFDQRAAVQFDTFADMSRSGDKTKKLSFNPQAARNFDQLRELGVSVNDFVSAVKAGRSLVAQRSKTDPKKREVRVYSAADFGPGGGDLIPTFWDASLYMYASWIGGIQEAGADVIPVTGNNTMKLPVITAYHAEGTTGGLEQVSESATVTNQIQDDTGTIELTPRPYRGFSAETDELMRSAVIDTRMMLLLRGLARSLQLGKELDFHQGNGSSKPLGILHNVDNRAWNYAQHPANTQIQRTGGNTTNIRYQDIPGALGQLDTEYHMSGRDGGMTSLMTSSVWFNAFVASVSSQDSHPIYPHLARGGREIFGTTVKYSSMMAKAPAENRVLAVVGNFMDAYVIATLGGMEVEVSDDLRFLEYERVYRIQEYCDGTVRDRRGLVYILADA